MSASATTWAWQVDGITNRQRLALLALADQANDDGIIRDLSLGPNLCDTLTRSLASRLHLNHDQTAAVMAELYHMGLADTIRSGATRYLQLNLTPARQEQQS